MDSKKRRAGQWFHSIHRAHLLDELVKLIPKENVSFGKKVAEVDQTEDEVRVTFRYGSIATASPVVGFDGIKIAQNSQMYCGCGGHALTFPIEKGQTMNAVAFQSKPDGKWEDERWVLPIQEGTMEADFEHWGGSVRNILNLVEKPDVWALFDHPLARTYRKGRICLLGKFGARQDEEPGREWHLRMYDIEANIDMQLESTPALYARTAPLKGNSQA
ncbi:hypothetical protein GJ744_012227 [Endocarpon pusillum]|uniref:Uncharacterized protein n=1 Tax=Endocarpon pusillum TaxID=364733 RepID=A0A8H7AFC5_9EURO|nr:hypothetical protein GJ744_012227 [Endocarpon pusillum]